MGEEHGQLTGEQLTSTIMAALMGCPGLSLKCRRCGGNVCQKATVDWSYEAMKVAQQS